MSSRLKDLGAVRGRAILAVCLAVCPALAGCGYLMNRTAMRGIEHGYTVVLPGIEGPSPAALGIAAGLRDGAPTSGVEIYDWTTGLPPLLLFHLRDLKRNRRQARIVAAKIIDYQDQHPGQPVHLVGHSAGAGIALLVAEALPPDRHVTSIILIAAAVSPTYDLRTALAKSERGIWNYSSIGDLVFLGAATTVCGTVDGVHGPAAGAVGFQIPRDATEQDRRTYSEKLHERPFRPGMLAHLNWGGHFGGTTLWFASHELALALQDGDVSRDVPSKVVRWPHRYTAEMTDSVVTYGAVEDGHAWQSLKP